MNRSSLLEENIGLAKRRVKSFMGARRPFQSIYDVDEANSDALEYLWKASEKFNPERGSFERYASLIIGRQLDHQLMIRFNSKKREEDLEDVHAEQKDDNYHQEFYQRLSGVIDVIGTLPEKRKKALTMFYLEGKTYTEISEALGGMKKGTVSMHLTKGIRSLRKHFGVDLN